MGLNFLIWVLNFESKKSYQEIAFSMGRFQKTTCSSGAARRRTRIRQYVTELGETDLKTAFASWEMMGSLLNLLLPRAKVNLTIRFLI